MIMDAAFGNIDGSKTAFVIESTDIKYDRFSQDITNMSKWLSDQGLKSGDYVGLLFQHPYWAWVAHLAAHHAGLFYATFTKELMDTRSKKIEGKLAAIVTDEADGVSGDLRVITVALNGLDAFPGAAKGKAKAEKVAQTGAGGRLIFTSGTTGAAKLVRLDDALLETRVGHITRVFGIDGDSRLAPRMGMNAMPVFGGCWAVNQSNVIITSPNMLKAVLNIKESWTDIAKRKVLVAGGRLSRPLRDATIKSFAASVMVDYGASETNCVAAGDASLLDRHIGAVGYPIDGAEVQIVDAEGNPKVDGEVGTIRTRSDGMVASYEDGAGEGTIFKDGWFYPGDVGMRMGDGLIAIVGRSSDVVNLGGTKLSLVDLEGRAAQVDQVDDVCAVTVQRNGQAALVFAVVCADGVDLKDLQGRVRNAVRIRRPFLLVRVPKILRNEMGKIQRKVMSERLGKALVGMSGKPN
jgi:acyl-coenzyme A synthetase/AMP-(fatty) acid ligase